MPTQQVNVPAPNPKAAPAVVLAMLEGTGRTRSKAKRTAIIPANPCLVYLHINRTSEGMHDGFFKEKEGNENKQQEATTQT